jgi:small subunit ribosomal protein S18
MSEENTVKKEAAPAAATDRRPARPARTEGGRPERPQRRGPGGRGKFVRRRKFCKFCADKSLTIDHKDPVLLGQFISERSKIIPSRVTSTCAKHQRQLTTAVKRARILALLSFTPLHHK